MRLTTAYKYIIVSTLCSSHNPGDSFAGSLGIGMVADPMKGGFTMGLTPDQVLGYHRQLPRSVL